LFAKASYVLTKESYDSGRIIEGNLKDKFAHEYRYVVALNNLIPEYDTLKDAHNLDVRNSSMRGNLASLLEIATDELTQVVSTQYMLQKPTEFLETKRLLQS
jgi:hypothetical protein